MIIPGNQPVKPITNINEEILNSSGELDDKEAQISLARFLSYNIGFSARLLMGVDLEPYQEMTLNAMFRKNNKMLIWSRGGAKSTLTAWYAILKCIFEPGTRIVIASANFRTSRRIFEYIENVLSTEAAELARQCFDVKPYKRNDAFSWNVNGGHITAIPLSEETRGMRCDILILDEVLLLAPDMINEVLAPFLSSPRDAAYRIKVKKLEDQLIRKGIMHPSNRMIFENTFEMILLSSAGYQFQHLYSMYKDWTSFIVDPNLIKMKEEEGEVPQEKPSFFVSQLSWEAIPATILNRSFIQTQRSQLSDDAFAREYGAQFKDGSDGYFSMKKMMECTITDGEHPHSVIHGNPDKKYILSIDPSWSKSETSDYFAMAVIEIDEENEEGTLVHGYQKASGTIHDHVKYFYYIMTHFNVVLICADSQGGLDTFIECANEHDLFKKELKKRFTYLDTWDSDAEGQDFVDMSRETLLNYKPEQGAMVIKQNPTQKWIANANSWLQTCIDKKRIKFASRASSHPAYISSMMTLRIPTNLIYPHGFGIKTDTKEETNKLSVREFVEIQDDIIWDTKEQCAAIELSQTNKGGQSFDLPRSARNSQSANKPRKDNYSALLLGNWGLKCYFDLMRTPNEEPAWEFTPILI